MSEEKGRWRGQIREWRRNENLPWSEQAGLNKESEARNEMCRWENNHQRVSKKEKEETQRKGVEVECENRLQMALPNLLFLNFPSHTASSLPLPSPLHLSQFQT